MTFLDTNVWVYALSEQDSKKRKRATELIMETFLHDTICVSAQVLKEFANFAFKKTKKSAAEINTAIEKIASYSFIPDTKNLIVSSVEIKEKYQLGFYDALIVAAAINGGCAQLYSEDLNDGQMYGSVRVINPFLE